MRSTRTTKRFGKLVLAALLLSCKLHAQDAACFGKPTAEPVIGWPTEDYPEGTGRLQPGQPVFSVSIRPAEGDNDDGNHYQGDHVLAGESMEVEVTLTNISGQNICLAEGYDHIAYDWDVRGPDGELRPLQHGMEQFRNRKISPYSAHNPALLLRAGKSITFVDAANSVYDNGETGGYTVQVRKKLSHYLGGGEVESNKILFTVVSNPTMERLKEEQGIRSSNSPDPTPTPVKKPSSSPSPTPTPAKNR